MDEKQNNDQTQRASVVRGKTTRAAQSVAVFGELLSPSRCTARHDNKEDDVQEREGRKWPRRALTNSWLITWYEHRSSHRLITYIYTQICRSFKTFSGQFFDSVILERI